MLQHKTDPVFGVHGNSVPFLYSLFVFKTYHRDVPIFRAILSCRLVFTALVGASSCRNNIQFVFRTLFKLLSFSKRPSPIMLIHYMEDRLRSAVEDCLKSNRKMDREKVQERMATAIATAFAADAVLALNGNCGIGKTTAAIEAARRKFFGEEEPQQHPHHALSSNTSASTPRLKSNRLQSVTWSSRTYGQLGQIGEAIDRRKQRGGFDIEVVYACGRQKFCRNPEARRAADAVAKAPGGGQFGDHLATACADARSKQQCSFAREAEKLAGLGEMPARLGGYIGAANVCPWWLYRLNHRRKRTK